MTIPSGDYRHPDRREHFVYRAWDADGRLLYVGCTMRLAERRSAHQTSSQWFPLAARFRISGPYNYDTGRRLEREAIRSEMPLWNCDEPHRVRIRALHQRVAKRWFDLEYNSQGRPTDWHPAHRFSDDRANRLIPLGKHRAGVLIADRDVALAAAAEKADRVTFNAIVRRTRRSA